MGAFDRITATLMRALAHARQSRQKSSFANPMVYGVSIDTKSGRFRLSTTAHAFPIPKAPSLPFSPTNIKVMEPPVASDHSTLPDPHAAPGGVSSRSTSRGNEFMMSFVRFSVVEV